MKWPPSAQEARPAGHAAGKRNKLQKVGVFFAPKKVVAKAPRLPRKPPQIDHKNTTTKYAFPPKPPAKTPVHHKIKNPEN